MATVTHLETHGAPSIRALIDPFETYPVGHADVALGLVGLPHPVAMSSRAAMAPTRRGDASSSHDRLLIHRVICSYYIG